LKSYIAKIVIQFKALLRYVYDAVFVNLNDKYEWQLYIHENQTKNHCSRSDFLSCASNV